MPATIPAATACENAHAAGDAAIQLDALQANLLMLMSQYTMRPCPTIADAIVDHIGRLYQHPLIDLVPLQKEAVARLSRLWCSRLPMATPERRH